MLIVEMEQFKRDQYNREGVRHAVAGFQSSTRSALTQLRDVVHGIQGGQVQMAGGLEEALRTGPVVELRDRAGVDVSLRVSRRWPRGLDNFTSIQLYRIAEQALRNVVDHSRASTVTVGLLVTGDELTMEIVDDGTGFPWEQQVKGQGLIGMEHRALLLGGVLKIAHRPPHGTVVRVAIPQAP